MVKDLEFNNNEKVEFIYDLAAGILAVIAVLVVMLEFSDTLNVRERVLINRVDDIIYWIFVIDVLVRMITTKNKKKFLKHNIIDLIAILPFGFFSTLEYGSAFKLLRIVSYALRLIGNIREILFLNGFIYALGCTILITILGSIGIYIFEGTNNSDIQSYGDGLWWSFVTVTTVGYGDISPQTSGGRFIACILMITGIGFLSMLTSTISTFFFSSLGKREKLHIKRRRHEVNEKVVIDISDLSEEKRRHLVSYYEYLKREENDVR